MITVPHALDLVRQSISTGQTETRSLAECAGLVLAEDLISPMDSPPFTKALMDGFAVRSVDISHTATAFRIVESITAGEVPTRPVGSLEATRIMTGSPLPSGTDVVVPIELCDDLGDSVLIKSGPLAAGRNMMPQGDSIQKGTPLLKAGRCLGAIEIGAAAELGLATVTVRKRLRIGVLSTGDELVAIDQPIGPGQIRNSNQVMLSTRLAAGGIEPVLLGIARDRPEELADKIQQGLQLDGLLLSGGVSAGTRDLVPQALADAGVQQIFHKVAIKPGKPVWFGTHQSQHAPFVFGLPGNPVSSLVCFEVFVREAIRQRLGLPILSGSCPSAVLTQAHLAKGERTTYYPAQLAWSGDGLTCAPIDWRGSADLCGTRHANGFLITEPGERQFEIGERIPVLPLSLPE